MTLMSHVSRRELLALLGTAGAAAAMFSAVGNVNAQSKDEGGQSVWTPYTAENPACRT
jgi:hypothetical protein